MVERRLHRINESGVSQVRLLDLEVEANWEFVGDMKQHRGGPGEPWKNTIYDTVIYEFRFNATEENKDALMQVVRYDRYTHIPCWIDGKGQEGLFLVGRKVDEGSLGVTLRLSNDFDQR